MPRLAEGERLRPEVGSVREGGRLTSLLVRLLLVGSLLEHVGLGGPIVRQELVGLRLIISMRRHLGMLAHVHFLMEATHEGARIRGSLLHEVGVRGGGPRSLRQRLRLQVLPCLLERVLVVHFRLVYLRLLRDCLAAYRA